MRLTHLVPAPIRQKLYPYKEKLYKKIYTHKLDTLKSGHRIEDEPPMTRDMRAFSEKYGTGYMRAMLERGWQEPGRMFDEIGGIFAYNRKLFILGEQEDINRMTRKVDFLGTQVDVLAISAQNLLSSADTIKKIVHDTRFGYTVIVAYRKPEETGAVVGMLAYLDWHFPNVNLFSEARFCGDLVPGPDIYLGIFSVYAAEKVYLMHNNLLTTTICNLNCEYCLNYTPYIKHPRHFDLEELKRSADIYFSHVDRVGLFELTGGEPLLNVALQDALQYIAANYGNKIGVLCFVTNGSVVPSDSFCKFLRAHHIFVFLDNYVEAIPKIKPTFTQTVEKLEKYGIAYSCPQVKEFVKSFPPLRNNMRLSGRELQEKYRRCLIGAQNLRDGKICSCTYHAFAVNAELISDDEDNWFDLSSMTESILDKRSLVEFRHGFNKKGYVDWCKYCNGHITLNTRVAPAAQQVKGKLDWDIDDPVFLDE